MLQEDFRRQALLSGSVVAVTALLTFPTARHGAPEIYRGLVRPSPVWIVRGATAIFAILAFVGLFGRRYNSPESRLCFRSPACCGDGERRRCPTFPKGI